MHGEFLPLFFLASLSLHFGECQDLIVPAVAVASKDSSPQILDFCEGCGSLCEKLCAGNSGSAAYRSCCEQVAVFVLKGQDFPGQKRSFDPINLYEDEGRFGKRGSAPAKRFLDDEDRYGKRSYLSDEDRFGKRSAFEDRFGKRTSLYGFDDRFGKRSDFEDDRFGKRSDFEDDRFGKRSDFEDDRFGKRSAFGKKRSSSSVGPRRY